jgi:hypothetical protein
MRTRQTLEKVAEHKPEHIDNPGALDWDGIESRPGS